MVGSKKGQSPESDPLIQEIALCLLLLSESQEIEFGMHYEVDAARRPEGCFYFFLYRWKAVRWSVSELWRRDADF